MNNERLRPVFPRGVRQRFLVVRGQQVPVRRYSNPSCFGLSRTTNITRSLDVELSRWHGGVVGSKGPFACAHSMRDVRVCLAEPTTVQ